MNPYNNVGKHILAECKARKVTYKYACVNKINCLDELVQQDREFLDSGPKYVNWIEDVLEEKRNSL